MTTNPSTLRNGSPVETAPDVTAEVFHWQAPDGLRLGGRIFAPCAASAVTERDASLPVLCLPGLSRNTRDFNDIAAFLQTRGHPVIALDYRGRGLSDWDPDWTHYSIEMEAADIDAAIDRLGLDRFAVLGTSRGGLHAMAMAARPLRSRLAGVILNDIGPHIEAESLARIATSIGKQMEFPSFDTLGQRLRADLGDQFTGLTEAGWVRLARQLAAPGPEGTVRLSYDPALGKTLNGWSNAGDAPAFPDLWPLFNLMADIPLMVLRGETSDLLSETTFREMGRRRQACALHTVAGEGHAPLLWDADTQTRIAAFLQTLS